MNRTLALATSSLALAALPALADTFAMTIASGHPPVTKGVAMLQDFFIPEIDKRLEGTGHSISWTEAYGGSLAGVTEVLEAVEGGITDFGYVPTLFEADKLPLEQVTYVTPFGSADIPTMTEVIHRLHDEVPEMDEAWRANNQMLMALVLVDRYNILTTFPVTSVDDLNGRKISTAGLATNWLRDTGAVPVTGGLPDFYNAVKTGLSEGLITFESAVAPYKFYEVTPTVTMVNFGSQSASALSVNLDSWDRLPPEVQQVISDVAGEYEDQVSLAYEELAEGSLKTAEDNGATLVPFPDEARQAWADKLPNIAREWAEGLDAKGLPGSRTLEAYVAASKDAGVTFARDWLAD